MSDKEHNQRIRDMMMLSGISTHLHSALMDATEVTNRTRELSLVITKIEEAQMWLEKVSR